MAEKRRPWMKFYPSDWRADPKLRMCSFAARGLWMDMLSLMHEADPYGHLTVAGMVPSTKQLASMVGSSQRAVEPLVAELEEASVFSRTAEGTIYSRRMVRDEEKAETDRNNGKGGGNPDLQRGQVPSGSRVSRFKRSDNPTKVKLVWEKSAGCCHYCKVALTTDDPNKPTAYEIDHVVPIRDGGDNDIANLVAACKRCNFERAVKAKSGEGVNPLFGDGDKAQMLDASKKEPVAKATGKKKFAPEVLITADFRPKPEVFQTLEAEGLRNVEWHLKRFIDWALSVGKSYRDPDAAFRGWGRRAIEDARKSGSGGGGQRPGSTGGNSISRAAMAVADSYRQHGLRTDGVSGDGTDRGTGSAGHQEPLQGFDEAGRPGPDSSGDWEVLAPDKVA